jgi:hypothetical protein
MAVETTNNATFASAQVGEPEVWEANQTLQEVFIFFFFLKFCYKKLDYNCELQLVYCLLDI